MKMKHMVIFNVLVVVLADSATYGTQTAERIQPLREDIEWLDVWMPNTNEKKLPRVLLVGDSITRAYPRHEA